MKPPRKALATVQLIEAGVHPECPATENRQVVACCVGSQCTGVGEGFAVVERDLAAEEEVATGGDHFVADWRVEVTKFDGEVT